MNNIHILISTLSFLHFISMINSQNCQCKYKNNFRWYYYYYFILWDSGVCDHIVRKLYSHSQMSYNSMHQYQHYYGHRKEEVKDWKRNLNEVQWLYFSSLFSPLHLFIHTDDSPVINTIFSEDDQKASGGIQTSLFEEINLRKM